MQLRLGGYFIAATKKELIKCTHQDVELRTFQLVGFIHFQCWTNQVNTLRTLQARNTVGSTRGRMRWMRWTFLMKIESKHVIPERPYWTQSGMLLLFEPVVWLWGAASTTSDRALTPTNLTVANRIASPCWCPDLPAPKLLEAWRFQLQHLLLTS